MLCNSVFCCFNPLQKSSRMVMPSMKMETHLPPPQGPPTGKRNESTRKVWSFTFFGARPAWAAAGHKIHGPITEKLDFKVSKLCPFSSCYFSSQPYMINCPKWTMKCIHFGLVKITLKERFISSLS